MNLVNSYEVMLDKKNVHRQFAGFAFFRIFTVACLLFLAPAGRL